jgi:hypothetical protein
MLQFAVIGLVCNALGCYWARDDDHTFFANQAECFNAAVARRTNSMTYFDTGCIIVKSQEK